MEVLGLLLLYVGGSAAKFLFKNWLSEKGEIAGGLIDLAKEKFRDQLTHREAARQFEKIGDKIAERLVPLFEREVRRQQINVEAMARELGLTLDGRISAEFFIERNLDPAKLTAAFREARPLPAGMFSAAEADFYDRALDEAVRYVVNISGALPRFLETIAAETLARLDEIQADTRRLEQIEVKLKQLATMDAELEKVLDITQRIERQVGTKGDQASRFEADYRQAIAQNLDYLELFGADILPESRRHSLSIAYVSLNLQRHGNKPTSDILPAEVVFDDLDPNAKRLLIRGDAGGGKSTLFRWAAIRTSTGSTDVLLLKHLAYTFKGFSTKFPRVPVKSAGFPKYYEASERITVRPFHADVKPRNVLINPDVWRLHVGDFGIFAQPRRTDLVPFLVRLRNCTDGELPSPDDFPKLIAKQAGNPPHGWVNDVLRAGRGLLLLDGVDEISGEFRDSTLYGEIEAIVSAFPENYFLISTRPEAVPEGWLARLGFREARITPMSDTDKGRFIDKWHQAVEHELANRGGHVSETSLETLAAELKEKLIDNPLINRLATNPLMCAMICALHRERRRKLPESQSELVEALCQMLLHRRELESGLRLSIFPEAYRNLTYAHKKLIVQDLAYHMVVSKQESVIARDEAERLIKERLERIGSQPEVSYLVLRTLVERSGMLREATPKTAESPGTLDFIHNTFKEYLAAVRLAEEGADGLLGDNAVKPDWLPVVLFAAATERKGFTTGLIKRILGDPKGRNPGSDSGKRPVRGRRRKPTLAERVDRQRQLIALRCRAVALDLDPPLRKELDNFAENLVPPRNMADADALAASGDVAIPFLKFRPGMTEKQAAACVRALRLIQTELARKYLPAYLSDARWQVVTELAQAMNPLEIPAVQQIIQRAAMSDSSWKRERGLRSQITDLSPLKKVNEQAEINTLNLLGTRINDISPLADLEGLERFYASETVLTDISPLATLERLQAVGFFDMSVGDFVPLSQLMALTTLDLVRTNIVDLSPLAQICGLISLNLSGTQSGDLSPLFGITGLNALNLDLTKVKELSGLAGLARLKTLSLIGTQVSDLSALADLRDLEVLDLTDTEVTSILPLSKLLNVSSLRLAATSVSDLSPLAGLTKLKSLDIRGTAIADLSPLENLRKLEVIAILEKQVVRIPDALQQAIRRF